LCQDFANPVGRPRAGFCFSSGTEGGRRKNLRFGGAWLIERANQAPGGSTGHLGATTKVSSRSSSGLTAEGAAGEYLQAQTGNRRGPRNTKSASPHARAQQSLHRSRGPERRGACPFRAVSGTPKQRWAGTGPERPGWFTAHQAFGPGNLVGSFLDPSLWRIGSKLGARARDCSGRARLARTPPPCWSLARKSESAWGTGVARSGARGVRARYLVGNRYARGKNFPRQPCRLDLEIAGRTEARDGPTGRVTALGFKGAFDYPRKS